MATLTKEEAELRAELVAQIEQMEGLKCAGYEAVVQQNKRIIKAIDEEE